MSTGVLQCLVDLLWQQLQTLLEAVETEAALAAETGSGDDEDSRKKMEREEVENEGVKEDLEGTDYCGDCVC